MWSVLFVFLSYLDRNFAKADFLSRALDAEKQGKEVLFMLNGTVCATVSTLGGNRLYQVSDGTEVVRSVVSPAGRLVNCSVTASQVQAKSFVHECRSGLRGQRAGRQLETGFARMHDARLMCREFTAGSERSGPGGRDGTDGAARKRSKRGFTYPGTLWCGIGNMADDYDQLGDFADTDSCCRTHDHCPDVIHAFSSNYGYYNFKWHSVCHCDCDNALKNCLRKVNDTSSRVVGQAFFNVIGVSCFELSYEEQCAERYWYGGCKRYEKFPVAVLKEAVPYDFGGIDVIDELTVAPPKKKESQMSQEEEKPESEPPSTMSGPEEPSLTNVVTAAEDFIKVLATVSTSQSSTSDSDKGQTQSSEKKKRKNGGKKKKTTKKQKRKGKGRKRKQKSETSLRIEEGNAVSPSGSRAEEVIALSNFINESHKQQQSRNGVGGRQHEPERKKAPSNELMKDEPAVDKGGVSVTSTVGERAAESGTGVAIGNPNTDKNGGVRKTRRKKKKPQDTSSTDHFNPINTVATTTPNTQPQGQRLGGDNETEPVSRPKVKKNGSKDGEDGEGRKNRRKATSASLIEAAGHENSSSDTVNPIPPTGAPTVPPVSTAQWQVSRWLQVYGGRAVVHSAPNSTFTDFKRQSWRERRLRKRKRKTAVPSSSEDPPFPSAFENLLPIPTAANGSADAAARSRLTEETQTQTQTLAERRLFTTAAPSITTKRRKHANRQRRKPKNHAVPAHPSEGVSALTQTMTFDPKPSEVGTTLSAHRPGKLHPTTTAAAMSPIQISIERARVQFTRKKKKKAAESVRHQ